MKRALIVLLFALTAFAARGAEPAVAEKGVERPNVIEICGGLTWDINSSLGYFFYAEYARHMKGKFWLGGRLGEAYETLAGNPVSNMVLISYFATTAYGIGYWEFPVARKWLSFRVGGGMVRAEWVVHITRNFGLSLSPLVIGPSQFEFGLAPGRKNGAMKMSGKLDWLGHLGLYVRF